MPQTPCYPPPVLRSSQAIGSSQLIVRGVAMAVAPSAAVLAGANPEEIGQTAEAAIARARAGVETVKSGTLTGLDLLDAYDEAMAALANTADPIDLVAVTHPDEETRDAA